MKGGRSLEREQQRINDALSNSYTPLINAIINQDYNRVGDLLENGADPNERDDIFRWCPHKWAAFMFFHGNDHDIPTYFAIQRKLLLNGARTCYDTNHAGGYVTYYNYYPIILPLRREIEDDEIDRRTAGGKRVKKSRKSKKSKKSKKSNKRTKNTRIYN
jgi:hypothetical protein